jgi:urease accessory protein UreF
MNPDRIIKRLLAAAHAKAAEDGRSAARTAARVAWVKATMAKLRTAQQRAGDAWMRAIRPLPEDHTDEELEGIPEPPEQAELDVLHAMIREVIDQDRWPAHLYWGSL